MTSPHDLRLGGGARKGQSFPRLPGDGAPATSPDEDDLRDFHDEEQPTLESPDDELTEDESAELIHEALQRRFERAKKEAK